ncbi:MAG: saccharopine dehydrogenase C-terminal domain-containing protein [Sulfolobales archaeon]|nr:saccharopine dehydrogenase NADP-binding domain-containing protein [Sulfolobales archaeon]MDW8082748.1 saccharopine dehydrogenase C-terminal domain-containing protein [Sulfolobales archaeon]
MFGESIAKKLCEFIFSIPIAMVIAFARIAVLGAGRIGSLVSLELSKSHDVAVADLSSRALEPLKRRVSTVVTDLSSEERLSELVREFELVVNALPGKLGYSVLKTCIKARRDIVDVSFMPEDPLQLRDLAASTGVTAVVDAGFAPGLSNIVVGRIQSELGSLGKVEINVGGLPKEPRPPLYHAILFSPVDLVDEYLRPARIVRNGRVIQVDPLSTIERVRVLDFYLERFPTDGLRTMLQTVRAENMAEYTLRWPGHLERMKILKELGLLDKQYLEMMLEVLEKHMAYEATDVSIMEVVGEVGSRRIRYILYDEAASGYSSMARVTGYTAVQIAELLIKGLVPEGLVAPEHLGADLKTFNYIVEGIKSRGTRLERVE